MRARSCCWTALWIAWLTRGVAAWLGPAMPTVDVLRQRGDKICWRALPCSPGCAGVVPRLRSATCSRLASRGQGERRGGAEEEQDGDVAGRVIGDVGAEDGAGMARGATDIRAGTLYIVATPIGNLGDITLRAIDVMRGVDVVASEDTRRTARLLQHLGISYKKLISHHEHNWRSSAPEIVRTLQAGQAVALVSDAGTPGICDPGMQLVAACIDAGIRVEPIPGACAAAAAVSVSAMAGTGFAFMGFLPPKGTPRKKALAAVAGAGLPVVIYEAPHRVVMTLKDLAHSLGGHRPLLVARELTKVHEELLHVCLSEAITHFESINTKVKGEFTLVIAASTNTQAGPAEEDGGEMSAAEARAKTMLEALLREDVSPSTAARVVQAVVEGVKKNSVKKLVTALVRSQEPHEGQGQDRDA